MHKSIGLKVQESECSKFQILIGYYIVIICIWLKDSLSSNCEYSVPFLGTRSFSQIATERKTWKSNFLGHQWRLRRSSSPQAAFSQYTGHATKPTLRSGIQFYTFGWGLSLFVFSFSFFNLASSLCSGITELMNFSMDNWTDCTNKWGGLFSLLWSSRLAVCWIIHSSK